MDINGIKWKLFPQSRPCQTSLTILFSKNVDFLDEGNVIFTHKMKLGCFLTTDDYCSLK